MADGSSRRGTTERSSPLPRRNFNEREPPPLSPHPHGLETGEESSRMRRSSVEKLPNVLAVPIARQRSHSNSELSPGPSDMKDESRRRRLSASSSPLPPLHSPMLGERQSSRKAAPPPPEIHIEQPARRERRRSHKGTVPEGLLQFQESLQANPTFGRWWSQESHRRSQESPEDNTPPHSPSLTGTGTPQPRSPRTTSPPRRASFHLDSSQRGKKTSQFPTVREEGDSVPVEQSQRSLHTKVFVPIRKQEGGFQTVTETSVRAKRYLASLVEEHGTASVRLVGLHTELVPIMQTAAATESANESVVEVKDGANLLKCIRLWFEVTDNVPLPLRRSSLSGGRRASISESDEDELPTETPGIRRGQSGREAHMPRPQSARKDSSQRRRQSMGGMPYVEECDDFELPMSRDTSMSDAFMYAPQQRAPPRRRATLTAAPDQATADVMGASGMVLAFPKLSRELSDRAKMIGGQIMRDDYLALQAEKARLKNQLRRRQLSVADYRNKDRDAAQRFQRSYAGTVMAVREQLEKMRLIFREKDSDEQT